MKNLFVSLNIFILSIALYACANQNGFISIEKQGSFFAGGVVQKDAKGHTNHADHAYVFWQIPLKAYKYPLIFAHGIEQSAKTWQSTPDGREGFDTLFLKEGFGVYLVDQPRHGKAGKSSEEVLLKPSFSDEMWFNHFRLGIYPRFFEDVSFPKDAESLEQFLRQSTPTIAKTQDLEVYARAYVALLERLDNGGILITHSQGGAVGWKVALQSDKIKGIVTYEPGGDLPFPKGEMPELGRTLTRAGTSEGIEISKEEFLQFTKNRL